MSEITWHDAGAWKDKRRAKRCAANFWKEGEGKSRARIKKEIYWRVEFAMEWPTPSKGGKEARP